MRRGQADRRMSHVDRSDDGIVRNDEGGGFTGLRMPCPVRRSTAATRKDGLRDCPPEAEHADKGGGVTYGLDGLTRSSNLALRYPMPLEWHRPEMPFPRGLTNVSIAGLAVGRTRVANEETGRRRNNPGGPLEGPCFARDGVMPTLDSSIAAD